MWQSRLSLIWGMAVHKDNSALLIAGPKGRVLHCCNAVVTHPNTFVTFSSILTAIEFLAAKNKRPSDQHLYPI